MITVSCFYEEVWELLLEIPDGMVTTYKEIAKSLGTNAYRAVGNACRNNPNSPEVPCHRVVRSSGKVGGFNGKLSGKNVRRKTSLLKSEGVYVSNSRIVDFSEKLFKFK